MLPRLCDVPNAPYSTTPFCCMPVSIWNASTSTRLRSDRARRQDVAVDAERAALAGHRHGDRAEVATPRPGLELDATDVAPRVVGATGRPGYISKRTLTSGPALRSGMVVVPCRFPAASQPSDGCPGAQVVTS